MSSFGHKNLDIMHKHFTYLDYAATTPIDKAVTDAMEPFLNDRFGNASSNHTLGQTASSAIEIVKDKIAKACQCSHDEIVFTSGATEAINLALKGYYLANNSKSNHIVTVKTEHKAILDTCEWLETIGANITYLPVDENGLVIEHEYNIALKESPLLVTIMHVNNETGVIQDIEKLAKLAHEAGAKFFSDTTQSFGKIDTPFRQLDMFCFSGHKIYGPKGVGALIVKKGIELTPLIHGGGQQNGMRSGTFNVPGIVGLGKAVELISQRQEQSIQDALDKMNTFLLDIKHNPKIHVNGMSSARSPYIINIGIEGQNADDLLKRLENIFALATGSACNSEVIEPSHVLQAMHSNYLENSIRISISPHSNLNELANILKAI